jgi:sterol desaturase/sphingolipid hydroxylase (fatty acid hydroxylase superfamily)
MGDGGEALVRLGVFAAVFAAVVAAETLWPFRSCVARGQRWVCNIGLSVLNTLVVRVLALGLPVLPVVVAAAFEGGGLFGLAGAPWWVGAVLGFVILDLAVYAQHVVFHHVPVLWRLHRVHHADTAFDVTTGIRFHPVEIVISLAWKLVVVVAFGIPALAVLVFEVVLNAGAMFSHANVSLPRDVDRFLRALIVTPDMHRVHHSVEPSELNSNFGFNLSVWDRAFGTYRRMTSADARVMPIGLRGLQISRMSALGAMLLFPFTSRKAS